MRWLAACVVALLVVGVWALMAAAPAEGHTDFIGADPHDGANLHKGPREVRLKFSDAMDPGLSAVTVQVDDGTSSPLELTGGAQKTVLVAAIPSTMRPDEGTTTRWTVRFRVVSRDGHPVVGTTTFVVRAPESESPSATPDASSATPDKTSPDSEPDTTGAERPDDPDRSDARASGDGEPAWPLLAVGVGVLALLVLGVGTVIRLAGRDPDK